ncbi:GNAT family N-acetyltransferase [Streptomyces genisteinicus]|uniref:GNAT family N-acetyltransferase n=1 Tax=Streptomyces genisteinicus TaxID=2768068 RepID=A0A7H0HXG4_9ACTN|nr:GNAT family N-acetyltransferase [Streptomyces genisteinicus]QNP65230.1 GNAT family N-acetyltransferase [Streptomyces genisteinicus]
MDITIRRIEPGEYGPLGELTAQAYLRGGLLDFGAQDPYLEVLRDVAGRAAHTEVYVAVDGGGALLGGVAFVPAPGPYADIAGPGEAEFRTLAVAEEARGRGAGEALVRVCVDRARALGRARLVLSTQSSMHTAHRIYGRLGFVRTPGRDWSPIPSAPLLTYALEL